MATSSIFETPTFSTKRAIESLAEAIKKSEEHSNADASSSVSYTELDSVEEINAFFNADR